MPTTIVIESYAEFAARHGGRPLKNGSTFIFPDGAMVSAADGNQRSEAPTDPYQLLKLKRDYCAAAVARASEEFHATRIAFGEAASLSLRYHNLPGAPPDAPKILADLRADWQECQAALVAVEEELAATPQAAANRQREADLQREHDRRAQLLQAISQSTLDGAPSDPLQPPVSPKLTKALQVEQEVLADGLTRLAGARPETA
jgi:hypothetical protein